MLIDKIARNAAGQVVNFRTHTQKDSRYEDLKIFMRRALYEEGRIPRMKKLSSGLEGRNR